MAKRIDGGAEGHLQCNELLKEELSFEDQLMYLGPARAEAVIYHGRDERCFVEMRVELNGKVSTRVIPTSQLDDYDLLKGGGEYQTKIRALINEYDMDTGLILLLLYIQRDGTCKVVGRHIMFE